MTHMNEVPMTLKRWRTACRRFTPVNLSIVAQNLRYQLHFRKVDDPPHAHRLTRYLAAVVAEQHRRAVRLRRRLA